MYYTDDTARAQVQKKENAPGKAGAFRRGKKGKKERRKGEACSRLQLVVVMGGGANNWLREKRTQAAGRGERNACCPVGCSPFVSVIIR